jgi:hypothetical protein
MAPCTSDKTSLTPSRSQNSNLPGARAAISARLRERFPELEAAVFNRVQAIADLADDADYRSGLSLAIAAAIEYEIATVELGERRAGPAPLALLSQARLAARHGVSLGTMHRRYIAGKHVLSKALLEETRHQKGLRSADLESLLLSQAAVVDRLLAQLEDEYEREARLRPGNARDRLAERVKQLLAGEPIDTSDLPYDFDHHHVGLVTEGDKAPAAIRDLAKELNGRPLIVHPGGQAVWAWVGTRRLVCHRRLDRAIASAWSTASPVAIGEPAQGLVGWRLTHRQARAVRPRATRGPNHVVRYADNAIVAAIERDTVLAASLRELYLAPLGEGSQGARLRKTLRAYFAADRNGQSAASELGVSRQTVANHLRSIEKKLGRQLTTCGADIEIALRLSEVDYGALSTESER